MKTFDSIDREYHNLRQALERRAQQQRETYRLDSSTENEIELFHLELLRRNGSKLKTDEDHPAETSLSAGEQRQIQRENDMKQRAEERKRKIEELLRHSSLSLKADLGSAAKLPVSSELLDVNLRNRQHNEILAQHEEKWIQAKTNAVSWLDSYAQHSAELQFLINESNQTRVDGAGDLLATIHSNLVPIQKTLDITHCIRPLDTFDLQDEALRQYLLAQEIDDYTQFLSTEGIDAMTASRMEELKEIIYSGSLPLLLQKAASCQVCIVELKAALVNIALRMQHRLSTAHEVSEELHRRTCEDAAGHIEKLQIQMDMEKDFFVRAISSRDGKIVSLKDTIEKRDAQITWCSTMHDELMEKLLVVESSCNEYQRRCSQMDAKLANALQLHTMEIVKLKTDCEEERSLLLFQNAELTSSLVDMTKKVDELLSTVKDDDSTPRSRRSRPTSAYRVTLIQTEVPQTVDACIEVDTHEIISQLRGLNSEHAIARGSQETTISTFQREVRQLRGQLEEHQVQLLHHNTMQEELVGAREVIHKLTALTTRVSKRRLHLICENYILRNKLLCSSYTKVLEEKISSLMEQNEWLTARSMNAQPPTKKKPTYQILRPGAESLALSVSMTPSGNDFQDGLYDVSDASCQVGYSTPVLFHSLACQCDEASIDAETRASYRSVDLYMNEALITLRHSARHEVDRVMLNTLSACSSTRRGEPINHTSSWSTKEALDTQLSVSCQQQLPSEAPVTTQFLTQDTEKKNKHQSVQQKCSTQREVLHNRVDHTPTTKLELGVLGKSKVEPVEFEAPCNYFRNKRLPNSHVATELNDSVTKYALSSFATKSKSVFKPFERLPSGAWQR